MEASYDISGIHDLFRQKHSSLSILWDRVQSIRLTYDAIHVSGFGEEGFGVV
jgi:hypothetical protein